MRLDDWYAVQVRSGEEFRLAEEIARVPGVAEAWCPRLIEMSKPSRHVKRAPEEVTKPLYGKYLFMRFEEECWWGRVTGLPHVEGFLSARGIPLPIRAADIQKIKRIEDVGYFDAVPPDDNLLEVGEGVTIQYGHPFAGFTGTILDSTEVQATIELTLFGRLNEVKVPVGLLRKIL